MGQVNTISPQIIMYKILLVSFLLSLTGCVAAPLVITGVGAASLAVNETTGKSITDHTVSAVNGGKDCKVSRMLADQNVCQDPNIVKLQVTTTSTKPSSVEEIQSKYR